jgi:hypothetical protein
MSEATVYVPFDMETETFWHDFDQYLYFAGGDATNMNSLGGVEEFFLGGENEEVPYHQTYHDLRETRTAPLSVEVREG